MGPGQIAVKVGMKEPNVRKLLSKLVEAGQLEKVGYGLYKKTIKTVHTNHTGTSDPTVHTVHTSIVPLIDPVSVTAPLAVVTVDHSSNVSELQDNKQTVNSVTTVTNNSVDYDDLMAMINKVLAEPDVQPLN